MHLSRLHPLKDKFHLVPAKAISGRVAVGKEEETLAAAKNSNLFLNTWKRFLQSIVYGEK